MYQYGYMCSISTTNLLARIKEGVMQANMSFSMIERSNRTAHIRAAKKEEES